MSLVGSNALAGASGQGGGGYEIERSLRFNDDDSAYLSQTPSSAGNRKTWTWSCWVKRGDLSATSQHIFGNYYNSANDGFNVRFSSDTLNIFDLTSGSFGVNLVTDRVFRDPSAWYHLVIVFDTTQSTNTDRLKLYVNGVQETSFSTATYPNQDTDYNINTTNLIAIGRGGSYAGQYFDGYLADIHFVDGQGLAASDFGEYDDNNVWQPKKYAGSYGTNNGFHLDFSDNSSNSALGTDSSGNGNNWTVNNLSTSAPYGVTRGGYAGSTTSSPPSDALWPTGLAYTAIDTSVLPSGGFNTGTSNFIPESGISSFYMKMFGSNNANGPWTHIAHWTQSETIGSNNWSSYNYLAFLAYNVSPTPAIGDHVFTISSTLASGNNVLVQGYDTDADNFVDSPTNGDPTNDTGAGGELNGNYCTFNPLATNNVSSTQYTYSDGNLVVNNVSGAYGYTTGTIYAKSGKWYAEFVLGTGMSADYDYIGITALNSNTNYPGAVDNGYWYKGNGNKVDNTGWSGTSYGATYASGDVIGVALDLDNHTVTFYKNGASQGVAFTGLDSSTSWTFSAGDYASGTTAATFTANFGQRQFAHAAPSGFKCLCTANLPDPTIEDPSKHFDTKLWTGNGSTQNITGYNFSPDLVWTKQRNSAGFHALFDPIRGVHNALRTNSANGTYTDNGLLTAFNSDGFSIGSAGDINGNNNTYVGWAWDAGSSNTTVSVGDLNTQMYNTSQTWSTYGTFDNNYHSSAYQWPGVFNTGNFYTSNQCLYVPSSTDKWTLTSSISVSSNVEIRTWGNTTIELNAGLSDATSKTSTGGSKHHHMTIPFTGNLASISVSGSGVYLCAVYVDGKQLVDPNLTSYYHDSPSISSTVRANPSAGVSCVQYTGTMSSGDRVAHGLNAAPSVLLIKNTATDNKPWQMYHTVGGNDWSIELNDVAQPNTSSSNWYYQSPNSSVFYLGGNANVNASGTNSMIAYCFAPVEGFSAFGSFESNNSADGPFVWTGFTPRWILIKHIDISYNWLLWDTAISPFNVMDDIFIPNETDAEQTGSGYNFDVVSNGFKIRNNYMQGSSQTLIYLAFAEHPFKTARAR